MSGISAFQTTALSETALNSLTPSGKRISQTDQECLKSRTSYFAPSIAESYIPEIHFARAERLTKVGPQANPTVPTVRQAVSEFAKQTLARRTFYFMVFFGLVNIFYCSMSLVPQFGGTNIASQALRL
jgi:hypothetical protein